MSLYKNKFKILFAFLAFLVIPVGNAYGHGMGFETTLIEVEGKKILVTVNLPLNFEAGEKTIKINAVDRDTNDNVENVTFLIGLFHDNKMIFQDYFFMPNGKMTIDVIPTDDDKVTVNGQREQSLDAWYATDSQPVQVSGPVFLKGGLFHFEFEPRTIDDPTNIIEDPKVFTADVSMIDTFYFTQEDVTFSIKSYFDSISNFSYDPTKETIVFEMPFDWSDQNISHIPVVHEEIHIPKNFSPLLSPGYVGKVNDVELFKSSVTIDDFSNQNDRIIHFVLLQDHLRVLKNEQKKLGDIPDYMQFTLETSETAEFPMTAMTINENFQVDLSLEPVEIEPGNDVKFIFTIRDGKTGEPLRQSSYDFIIIQNGKQIHKKSGVATVGGGFESFTFSDSQTGPTIIRFDNIRNSGTGTEFGIVVIPEFGPIAVFVLVAAMLIIFMFEKNLLAKIRFR